MKKLAATVILVLATAAGLELGANPAVAASSPGLSGASRVAPPTAASQPGTSPAVATPGARLWVSHYNGPGNADDLARSVAVSPSGDAVYVTGNSYGGTATGGDYATVAYHTATGARVWAKRYNGPGNRTDAGNSVAISPSGTTVYVTGSSDGGTSGVDHATVAYNS